MPKNRMTIHDPDDELPPVTIELLGGELLRFTQVDAAGRTNSVTFSDRFGLRRGLDDMTAQPVSSVTEGS